MGRKPRPSADPNQFALDFSSVSDDRLRRLNTVMRAAGGDLHQWQMLFLTFHHSRDRGFVRTVDELAYLLWCSERTVRRVTAKLEAIGVLTVTPHQNAGGDSANEYAIDWETVDRLASRELSKRFGVVAAERGAVNLSGGAANLSGGGGLFGSAYKEITPPENSLRNNSGPDRKAGPEPEERNELVSTVPELVDAEAIDLEPLPAGELVYGVFKAITEGALANGSLVVWHRRQLSTPRPVAGGTEADLILTVAAGLYAAKCPASDVRRGRVALFIWIVSRGRWRKCAGFIREAAERLQAAAEREGRAPWRACETKEISR